MPKPNRQVATLKGLMAINYDQRLYLVPAGSDGSFSCLGFDVCRRWTQGYADFAGRPELAPAGRVGTIKAFRAYQRALAAALAHNRATGRRAEFQLTPALTGLEGRRVEVTDREGRSRRFNVGRSTGFTPIHLEIANRASTGGMGAYLAKGDVVRTVDDRSPAVVRRVEA